MKGTLSLVISIVVAALGVAVPAAFADTGLNGPSDVSSTPTPDWFERAAAAAERRGAIAPYVDAFERPGMAVQTSAPDWFERAAAAAARDISSAPYVDAFERSAPVSTQAAPYVDAFERSTPVSTQAVSSPLDSGTDIAWGQIGIAFGIGLMLALGLVLAVRSRPGREAAR
jgi:hypothetical protein